jgi:AraC-like DNA-binding protein
MRAAARRAKSGPVAGLELDIFRHRADVLRHRGACSGLTVVEVAREPALPARYIATMERPTHAPRYAGIAPARVSFGAPVPGLRISLPAAALELPLAMANPRAARAAEERCRAQLNQARSRRRWSDWCAMMLRESEDCRPTLGELAGIMNVCPRTLSRYLETEGTGFRSLSLKVRTARARQLLREGALSVTQIAYRLGYADVASFVRSFRAQCGRTPGAWRSRHVVAHGKFSLRRKEQRPAG